MINGHQQPYVRKAELTFNRLAMPKILVAAMTLAEFKGGYRQVLTDAGFELIFPPQPKQLAENELLEYLSGVVASVAGSEPYTRRVIESHPQLRHIARIGVGFDAVDLVAATEAGIVVTTTAGSNHEAVAEHTFALLLALAKSVVRHDVRTRQGLWPRQTNKPLRGQTLGIVGLGRIGQAVARRAQAFGMRLIACEPVPNMEFVRRYEIDLAPLSVALSAADFVSLHVPLTAETANMINRGTLALMKPAAFLINTSRGGVVCELDLMQALQQGVIAGAGLDVFENEPVRDHRLFALDNVVLTPHTAGSDLRSREDMAMSAAESVLALSRGQWPIDRVANPEVRPQFRW
jgi:phosphoglycerate dehydrogenase-like enzyme